MQVRSAHKIGRWLTLAAALVTATTAGAQDLEPLEQRGLRTGAFNLFPSLTVGLGYNDNVLATPDDSAFSDVTADFTTIVTPALLVETNTQRHRWFMNIGAESGRFFDLSEQNYDDFSFATGLRYDLSRTLSFAARVNYADDHESAEDPDRRAEQLRGTTEISRFGGRVSMNKEWRRSFLRFATGFRRSEFDDLGSEVFPDLAALNALTPSNTVNTNDGRDLTAFPSSLRLGYAVARTYDVFVDLRYNAVRYDRNDIRIARWGDAGEDLALACSSLLSADGPAELAPGAGGNPLARAATRDDCFRVKSSDRAERDRDFDSWRMQFGSELDIDRLVAGEFSLGVEYRTFADAADDSALGFSFDADLDFTLSPRTLFALTGEQATRPTSNGATLVTNVRGTLTHLLSRQTQVGAAIDYERDDRQGSDRLDNNFRVDVFGSYALNRFLSVAANYSYRQRMSTRAAREFEQNSVFLTLRVQY